MKNPVSIGEELLHAMENAKTEKLLLSWKEFYGRIGDEGAYVTDFYIDRMNSVLRPKGFRSFKSSHGLVVRSIKAKSC